MIEPEPLDEDAQSIQVIMVSQDDYDEVLAAISAPSRPTPIFVTEILNSIDDWEVVE